MRKTVFTAGLAAGYVLGARAGRDRYESIARAARRVQGSQTVQSTAGVLWAKAGSAAGSVAGTVAQSAKDKLPLDRLPTRLRPHRNGVQNLVDYHAGRTRNAPQD